MIPWRPAMMFWSIVGQAIFQTAGPIGPSTSERSNVLRPGASAGIAAAAATAPSPAGTPSAPRIAPESETLVIEWSVASSSTGFRSRRKVLRTVRQSDSGATHLGRSEAGKVLAPAEFRGEHNGGPSHAPRYRRRSSRGREGGREGRQVPVDPGRGVRSRGDAPYPGGQTRRAVDQTGDRD